MYKRQEQNLKQRRVEGEAGRREKMSAFLEFKDVTKKYGNGVTALNEVSFQARQGEFISVIGPSGSGKSTLLRSINKLIPITKGEIFLEGEDISHKRGKNLRLLRRKIGMIFQNYNLVDVYKRQS